MKFWASKATCLLFQLQAVLCLLGCNPSDAWTLKSYFPRQSRTRNELLSYSNTNPRLCPESPSKDVHHDEGRRSFLSTSVHNISLLSASMMLVTGGRPPKVYAYTPDPDKLKESLYLISRVQEATVQQERFVNKATTQQDLKAKMKLTLKLVEKNYRLLDQINYASGFVTGDLVVASEAGYEAVDSLQGAIDFVRDELNEGPLLEKQQTFLTSSMQSCRENLFVFLEYMPPDKLDAARKRVEEENVLNRDEFDGDADAGVYNPVALPWKNRS